MSRVKELGQKSIAITDHGTISGVIELFDLAKKENIKPVAGIEFYVSNGPLEDKTRNLSHLVVLAKNINGYKSLLKLVSLSNTEENYYHKPRVTLEQIKEYANGDLIGFSGHAGSTVADSIIKTKDFYSMSYEDAKKNYIDNIEEVLKQQVSLHQDVFGKDNFFLEIQLFDQEEMPAQKALALVLRRFSEKHNIKKIATADSHYARQEDAIIQRILLCSILKTTFKRVQRDIQNGEFGLECFFRSDKYYIPSEEEIRQWHTDDEIENVELIDSMIESYDIIKPPQLPKFSDNDFELVKKIARAIYKEKIVKKNYPYSTKEIYSARINEELKVVEDYGLGSYFLIVSDYINWAKRQGILVGPSRGSSGGSLLCYLLGITEVNPLQYDLLFSRFINKGRMERGSLPDIDTDFMVERREEVFDYITEKYGKDKVAQITTFLRFKARAAVKEVLRVFNACDFEVMNTITKHIPQENTLSEEFEAMKQDELEQSAILYAVMNKPELHDFVTWDGKQFQGDYAEYFSLAMRLEGTIKGTGKHAAGVIIGSENLDNLCPLIRTDKDSKRKCGFDMSHAEKAGLVKLDILGLAALDKIAMCYS